MRLDKNTVKKYKKEIVEILKKDKNAILMAVKILAPKDTGLMANNLDVEIKETAGGFSIKVIGHEGNKSRVKNGKTYKPREYFYPKEDIKYMGPRSLNRAGEIDKGGKEIKPFIRDPLEKGIERAVDTLLAKYGVRLEVGWDAR